MLWLEGSINKTKEKICGTIYEIEQWRNDLQRKKRNFWLIILFLINLRKEYESLLIFFLIYVIFFSSEVLVCAVDNGFPFPGINEHSDRVASPDSLSHSSFSILLQLEASNCPNGWYFETLIYLGWGSYLEHF